MRDEELENEEMRDEELRDEELEDESEVESSVARKRKPAIERTATDAETAGSGLALQLFRGHTAVQLRQLMHSSLVTLSEEYRGMPIGQLEVQSLQLAHFSEGLRIRKMRK